MLERLAELSAAAGVDHRVGDPFQVWLRLRDAHGRRITVVDLYTLVATRRGLRAPELPLAERADLSRAALVHVYPGFEMDPGGARPPEPVRLCPYDEEWPLLFATWRDRLDEVLDLPCRVAHVGSTSVPGSAAKPVIDIQLSVPDQTDEEAYVPQLGEVGIVLRSRDRDHRFLRPAAGAPRDVHMHVCDADGRWERDHLLFRDFLRARPAERDMYATLKHQAAATWRDDRIAYTAAKTAVILDLLDEAEEWARRESWRVVGGPDTAP